MIPNMLEYTFFGGHPVYLKSAFVSDFTNLSENIKLWNVIMYLRSPWKMHSNKYKHAQYWFDNS